ncbi:hypothetical protein BD311DRAFT_650063 [Dichomitus squalens]|uniref:Uncharacterized protein n=1 Tax=Dichomitus squalens TaxID=114155 RepID=A0A4Q9N2H3_9APHY|nr:hypothetical protein BD311DRAFT_650063 [Dichomitus squalens]
MSVTGSAPSICSLSDVPSLKEPYEAGDPISELPRTWFLVEAIGDASNNLTLHDDERVWEWSTRHPNRRFIASYAVQCALAATARPEWDATYNFPEQLQDMLPLDLPVVVLDGLWSGHSGPFAEKPFVKAVEELAQRSENLETLVKRRLQHPGPELGRIGTIITSRPSEPYLPRGVIFGWESNGQTVTYTLAFPTGNWQLPEEGMTDLERAGLSRKRARKLFANFPYLGRYFEDVSFSEVDSDGNPMGLVLTAEARMLYPDDDVLQDSMNAVPSGQADSTVVRVT